MERNNEQVKNVWRPLCLVLAALLALSWLFFGFLYSKGGVDFSTLEAPEQKYMADGGAVIGDSVGSGVKIKSAAIPAEQFAENGVSAQAESAYTLTATVEPAEATNKAVDWSAAFVDPDSAWATGKTVTDYVTVTPTADGALTASVACLQAFGEQIKVTVTSRDNPTASAACNVDYVQKFERFTMGLKDSVNTSYVTFKGYADNSEMETATWKWSPNVEKPNAVMSVTVYLSNTYTIATDYTGESFSVSLFLINLKWFQGHAADVGLDWSAVQEKYFAEIHFDSKELAARTAASYKADIVISDFFDFSTLEGIVPDKVERTKFVQLLQQYYVSYPTNPLYGMEISFDRQSWQGGLILDPTLLSDGSGVTNVTVDPDAIEF